MPRNRIISQSETLYVGPSPATGFHFITGAIPTGTWSTNNPLFRTRVRELYRVQSINHNYNLGNLTPIQQFGELNAIDYVATDTPVVGLSYNYLLTNFVNERAMGLTLSSGSLVGALSGILNKTDDEKNYFILTRSEGSDVHGNNVAFNGESASEYITAIGNGFITNYSVEAAVGGLPTVSVSVEASNMNVDPADRNILNYIPAIDPTNGAIFSNRHYALPSGFTSYSGQAINSTLQSLSAIKPGDITVTLDYTDQLGASKEDLKIQSFQLQIPLSREPINKLGNKFAFAREIQFPLNATLSVNALVGDLKTGSVVAMFNDCAARTYGATVRLNNPCGTDTVAAYILRGGQFVGQEISSSVGANKTVTLNFQFPIGGPTATGANVFLSGISYDPAVFPVPMAYTFA